MHSASHGSHVCHKCGWAFPNPHPSAKQRRAHKKVCGRVEGFKENNVHLSISDDEEDHDKGEETMSNVKSSGSIGRQVSNRSEEEEFSDAVTEFADAGTSSAVAQATVVVDDVAEGDLKPGFSENVIKPLETHHSSQTISPEVVEKVETQLENDMQSKPSSSSEVTGLVSDLTVQSSALELREEANTSACSVAPVETNLPEKAFTENIQTRESFSSLAQIDEDTGIKAKDEVDGSLSAAEASFGKTESEASEMDLNLAKMERDTGVPLDVSDVRSATLPADGIMDVENVGASGQNEVDGSLSTAAASFGKTENEASEMDLDLLQVEKFTEGVPLDVTDVSDVKSVTLPVDGIMDVEVVSASGQNMSQYEVPLGRCSGPIEVEAIEHVGAIVDGAQVEAGSAQQSGIQSPNDIVDICNEEKVNETYVPTLPKPAEISVEEQSALDASDYQDQKPAKLEPSQTFECGEATAGTVGQNLVYKEGHPDFLPNKSDETANMSSSAMQVLEHRLPQEGALDKSMVEDAYAEGEHYTSEAKDIIKECLESNGLGLPCPTTSDIKYSNAETNQVVGSLEEQESHFSQHDLSCKIPPQIITEVLADCDTMVFPEDAVNNEANDVTHKGDAVHEEGKNENLDLAEKCNGEATVIEDLSTDREFGHKAGTSSELKPNLEETMSAHLDAFKHSSGTASNASQDEDMLESSYDYQDCLGENFPDGSEEPEIKGSIDSSSVSEILGVDTAVAVDRTVDEPLHVDRKLNIDTEVAKIQSGTENPELKESMPSLATDSGNNDPSLMAIEGSAKGLAEGDTSDVLSSHLIEEDKYPLFKQQAEASPIVPPEGSVDSISQTDSLEGQWGSVSDGNITSSRYATDGPSIFAAEAQPGAYVQAPKQEARAADLKENTQGACEDQFFGSTDIAVTPSLVILEEPGRVDGQHTSSEIQAVENQQQLQSSSLLSHVVQESQGKKKNEEEIISSVASWSSDKSHTPLRSLLVGANLESKQKMASVEGHLNPPTQKDDAIAATKEGLSANNQAPPAPPLTAEVSIYDDTKRNSEKEWNSPARLPNNSREKKKVRSWVPFVCCSSVN